MSIKLSWHALRKHGEEGSSSLVSSIIRNVGVVLGQTKLMDGMVYQRIVKMVSGSLERILCTGLGTTVRKDLSTPLIVIFGEYSSFISRLNILMVSLFPELSPCPVCAKPRRLCFPAVSRVTLESGESISMRQLNIGDRVRTLGTNGLTLYSEVIAFLHKEIKTTAKFYNLKTNAENIVRLSSQHLIFRKKNVTSPISAVFASEINIGDLLYVFNENVSNFQAVTKITMTTEIGVYAPLTRQGTLLVDGALVSCYAHWPSHYAAHLVMAPLRAAYTLYRAWERLTGIHWYSTQQTEGIQWYARALMPLSYIFMPQ